jgi:hypothetical protein
LPAEHAHVFRRFRPADRIRDEFDAIGQLAVAHQAVELDHKLHILADGAVAVAAHIQNQIAPEQAKGAGDDGQHLHAAERQPRHQESAQIFDDLDEGEEVAGQLDLDHAARPRPGCHWRGEWCRRPRSSGPVPRRRAGPRAAAHRIRAANPRRSSRKAAPRDVDAGIERVRFAAILLVDNKQARQPGAGVKTPDWLMADREIVVTLHRLKPELLDDALQVPSFDPSLITTTSKSG